MPTLEELASAAQAANVASMPTSESSADIAPVNFGPDDDVQMCIRDSSMSEVALVSVYQMVIVFAFAGVTGLRKS